MSLRRAPALLVLLLTAWASAVAAQVPALAVRADAGRVLLTIGPVLADRALEDAARAGLPIRLRVRVELWRVAFFDQLVAEESFVGVVLFDPLAERFRVGTPGLDEDRTAGDWVSSRALVERVYALRLWPSTAGRHYYTATLEVETLSLSDLEELQRWLKGELQPAVSGERSVPAAVGTGLRRLFVRLLRLPVRRYEARSGVFAAPAG